MRTFIIISFLTAVNFIGYCQEKKGSLKVIIDQMA